MARILIADDHAVTRAGYRQFLETEASDIIGEAASGAEVLGLLAGESWDLLLLDIQLPDYRGFEILRRVQQDYPALRVLIVSGLPEELYAREAIRMGAKGYVSKECAATELVRAVRAVLAKRSYVSESLAELMVADLDRDHDKPVHERLSKREFQVFCLVASGVTVSQIGKDLGISVKSVSTYRARILEKMNFKGNADMTAYAIRNSLRNSPVPRTTSRESYRPC